MSKSTIRSRNYLEPGGPLPVTVRDYANMSTNNNTLFPELNSNSRNIPTTNPKAQQTQPLRRQSEVKTSAQYQKEDDELVQ